MYELALLRCAGRRPKNITPKGNQKFAFAGISRLNVAGQDLRDDHSKADLLVRSFGSVHRVDNSGYRSLSTRQITADHWIPFDNGGGGS